jgi:hypothetical protein
MKYTDKTEITENENMQLIGLLVLAKAGNERMKDILKAVMAITGETEDCGHSSDAVYSDYTADELMEKLGITVSANGLMSRPATKD